MGYVIKNWKVTATSVEIDARREGIVSFLLSLIKVEPILKLRASPSLVQYEAGNWLGHSRFQTHPTRIVATTVGFKKNYMPLVLGFIFLVPTFGISFVAGIIFYYLSKEVSLGFRVDGRDMTISFKSSVIHGTKVDENSAADAALVLENLSLIGSAQLVSSKAA